MLAMPVEHLSNFVRKHSAFDKLIQGKHLDKAIKWIITYTIFNFTIISSEHKGLSLVIIVKVNTDT